MTSNAIALSSLSSAERAYLGFMSRYSGDTHTLYERHLNYWFKWCGANNVDPLHVERTHVELYVRDRLASGIKPSTMHTEMTPVKGLYKYAMIDGLIDRDPAAYIRLPRIFRERRVALDRNEVSKMLMVARETSPRHWALISLMGVMGMRVSETLRITDDSFSEQQKGYQILRWTAKGSKPRRLPLPASVLRALEAAAAVTPSPEGILVCALDGTRLHRSSASGLVNTVVRRAKLDRPVNPHLLRASAISHLLDAGVEIRDVANYSGHDDVRTISRHYDLTGDNPDRSAVHILAARLAS